MISDFENKIGWELAARYFTGQTDLMESKRIEKWLDENNENMSVFVSIKEAWENSAITNEIKNLKTEEGLNKVHLSIEQHKNDAKRQTIETGYKIGRRTILSMAASIVVFVCLAFALHHIFFAKSSNLDFITANNEIKQIILPDGSLVTLNEKTRLTYPIKFDSRSREVFLDGEAFFEVKRNEKLPFVINTRLAKVKVLGTTFNVNAYSQKSEVEVVVSTGKVQMTGKDTDKNNILIEPGFRGNFDVKSGIIAKSLNQDQNYLAWKTNRIIFKETPLIAVMRTIEKQYKVKFILKIENTENCRLTARFDKMPLGQVLDVIAATLNINVKKIGNQYEITGKGCKQITE